MRVFATKWFTRFARKERITDRQLSEAIQKAERGSIDADLGGGVIKQRVARAGAGRSGGYRTLIAYRALQRGVFLYGFAKNERGNIDDDELASLKRLAKRLMNLTDDEIEKSLEGNELRELDYHGEDEEG